MFGENVIGITEELGKRKDVTWKANDEVGWNWIVKEILLCQIVYSLGNKKKWKLYVECDIIGYK